MPSAKDYAQRRRVVAALGVVIAALMAPLVSSAASADALAVTGTPGLKSGKTGHFSCTLLSSAEMTKLLGKKVTGIEPGLEDTIVGISECNYRYLLLGGSTIAQIDIHSIVPNDWPANWYRYKLGPAGTYCTAKKDPPLCALPVRNNGHDAFLIVDVGIAPFLPGLDLPALMRLAANRLRSASLPPYL